MFEALLSQINFSLREPIALHLCLHILSMHIFAHSCKNCKIFLLALTLPSLLFSLHIGTHTSKVMNIISSLFSVYCVVISTVGAYSLYVWRIMHLQFY
jgi:hypothetical protein